MLKCRAIASVALLALLGTMFPTSPAGATAHTPVVRLAGELVQAEAQQGAGSAAIRVTGGPTVPIRAESVTGIASGSAVTVDVVIPADVRVAAAANRTLTNQGVDGKEIAVPLRASDLAAASDGSPESFTSAIGRATVAEATAPETPELEVSKVVAAAAPAADPVSTFTRATRRLYIAVVTPKGGTPRKTVDLARIQAQINGASSYWSDVTGGFINMKLAAAVKPQYTSAYTCGDSWGMWGEAASRMGLNPNSLPANTSVVVELAPGVSQNPACGYGMGSIGKTPNSSGSLYASDDVWPVLAHELGHNMSLQHADALVCPGAADSAYSTSSAKWTGTGCWEKSYGDGQDIMSMSSSTYAPFLSAPQSLRVGFIPPSAATVINTASTRNVTLLPLAGRAGLRTAEVVDPTTGVHYYVEYRTKAGRDLKNLYGVKTGVRVLRYNPGSRATVLLDPSPSGQFPDPDPTLPVGATFTSYDGRVKIKTVSVGSANAVVTITITSTAPGAPTAVVATPGNGSAAVSWAAPSSSGATAITGYKVTASPGGQSATTAGATATTVTGLPNGIAHTFAVSATNASGTGPASVPSAPVTWVIPPGAPAWVSATIANRSADLTWTTPTNGGSPILSYTATAIPGGNTVTVLGPSTSATMSGLTNGIPYRFTVTATNKAGVGQTSALSAFVTPAPIPGAPRTVTATAGNRSATVSWSAPLDDGGSDIRAYTVTAAPGGATVTEPGESTSATLTGLTNGTAYTFTVRATNVTGDSPASARSAPVTPATIPGAPTGVSAIAGNGSASVSWVAPISNGGAAITGYAVTVRPGGRVVTTMGAPVTVTGLTNGTSYTFTVRAVNRVDPSTESAASAAVTPKNPMDFNGDHKSDVLRVAPNGDLLLYRGSGAGGFVGTTKLGTGWGIYNKVFFAGDFTGDRKTDVMAVTPGGDLYLYRGNGAGGWAASRARIGTGWNIYNQVFSPGDSTGDGRSDVMAVTTGGDFYLYRGNGAGGWAGSRVKTGAGWNIYNRVFSPGDFTGDGKADVMAVTPGGDFYLYRGNGAGGWAASRLKIGAGWNIYNKVFAPGDFTGDRLADVMAVTPGGDLYLYRGNGAGSWAAARAKIASGMG